MSLDPATEAGASEWFAEAWTHYTAGDFAGAARLLDEQIAAYRTVFLKRRATYWSARAHERGGDANTAKALYAGLVPGTVPDLYARWAAAALGVTLPAAPPAAVSAGRRRTPPACRARLRASFSGAAFPASPRTPPRARARSTRSSRDVPPRPAATTAARPPS